MWSPGLLKVINNDSSLVLQELLADCQNVHFSYSTTDGQLLICGYWDSNLYVFPALNPENANLIPLENAITSCRWYPSIKMFYLSLESDQLVAISKKNQLWSYAGKYNFNLLGGKLLECFPLSPAGALLFIRIPGKLIVGFSANPPEWKQIAKIDCLEEAQSVQICLSPLSKPNCCIVLIGTEDGHVYQLQLENPNLLTLLFDLQQPVVSILNPDNQTILVGRYGKIARLNSASKDAQVSFAPTDISDCFFSGRQLYLMGSDQLYSMELKQTKGDSFLGEANYCKVKFVRAINLMNETVVVLTENGTIYQSSLNFGDEPSSTRLRTGTEIKPILLEIHRCTDETKALGIVSQNVHDDITQISIALHMLNQTLYEQFPAAVRSFADPISPRTQRLIISVTNNSTWNLLSSHWAFQICANDTDQSSNLLKQEWKTDETLELEHRLPHLDDTFHAEVKISLVFRVIDPRKPSEPQSLCVFPLSTVELTVLDFLDPGVSDHFDAKNKSVDIIGFCRDKVDDCPWGTILQRSWHRGFAKWLSGPPPLQIVLLCGSDVVRMTLQKDENNSDKIWTLRIETSSSNLLRLLRKDIFRLIETNNPPTASEFVKVPSHVIAHLQSLRGRLNYIQSLSQWDQSDVEPLMEEIRHLMAKQFYIR